MALPSGMICRAWISKDGERIYAKDYGKRAFCFYPRKKIKRKELPQTVAPTEVELPPSSKK